MTVPTDEPPTLTDGEVVLRPHRPEDAQRSYEATLDPAYQQWTSVPLPASLDGARSFVGDLMPGAWRDGSSWGFAIDLDGRYAGTIELRPDSDREAGVAEVAYGSHPDVRGVRPEGPGTPTVLERALRLACEWGFSEAGLHTVLWRAHRGNWASRRLAWKVGFRVEGTVRQWLTQRGTRHDAWVGTLLRGDPREPTTPWLEARPLTGERVRLRPFNAGDLPRVVEACSEATTQRWLGTMPAPYDARDAAAYLLGVEEKHADGTGVTWAVTDPATDELIGSMGLFDLEPQEECEIGYWTHPDARGRGLTREAAGLALRFAFGVLAVQRVVAFAAVENTASRGVLEGIGLREYGVERLGARVRGGRADQVCLDVLRSEWLAQQAEMVRRARA